MEFPENFEQEYQGFMEGCMFSGVEIPSREQYITYLNYRHLLDSGEHSTFNWQELQQVMLREQIIENAAFPNGRWNGATKHS